MRVLMFGPGLQATSGISAVVNHWLDAGLGARVRLRYVSTLDQYVPGQYLKKLANAARAVGVILSCRPRPDLVHIHISQGMSFYRKLAIFFLARRRRLRIIVHLHGSTFRDFYYNGSDQRRRLIGYLFDNANVVIVLSESWKAFVAEISPKSHIRVIHNGASIVHRADDARYSENNLGTEIWIAFMGRLGARKGVYDLLNCFELLHRRVPNSRLVVGGDGDIDNFRDRVRNVGLEHCVDVLGWVSGEEKQQVFSRADIYVLPSYNEGLPGSIVEAMACGKPIVSTPVGGIPEAVIEGVNGYLVTPGDVGTLYARLLLLCQDAVLRSRMGAASRRMAEDKFNLSKIVDQLVSLYEDTSSDAFDVGISTHEAS